MKDYPSVPGTYLWEEYLYAFDKLDGSNMRAEWNRKQGWYKFGSRTQLISDTSGFLNEFPDLLRQKYAEDLEAIFREERYESAVAFFEFWGPNSMAGHHAREPHTVTLLDVSPYRKGILPPKEFLRLFGHLDVPGLLYEGPLTDEFILSVKDSSLEGMTLEGVVCKAKTDRKTEVPVMFKIKSSRWLDKLRDFCGDNKAMFERLK
jgi:hypothetical protein